MSSYYVCAFITVASAFTSLGFSIVAISGSSRESRITALYAASRSVALAFVSLVPLLYVSTPFLAGIASVMIVVQGLDAVIGFRIHNAVKSYGPAVTALVNLVALALLM